MKKTTKRMSLSKETLRSLTHSDLREVNGAATSSRRACSGDGGFGSICSDCAPDTWTCGPPV